MHLSPTSKLGYLSFKAYANRNVHQMLGFSIEEIKRWKHQQMLPRCSMCVKKHYC